MNVVRRVGFFCIRKKTSGSTRARRPYVVVMVGGILLATLYTGTGGWVHEELLEPHCWLRRWTNGMRPSVKS